MSQDILNFGHSVDLKFGEARRSYNDSVLVFIEILELDSNHLSIHFNKIAIPSPTRYYNVIRTKMMTEICKSRVGCPNSQYLKGHICKSSVGSPNNQYFSKLMSVFF